MNDGNIQEAVRIITALWRETGKSVSAEETRRWIQPHTTTILALSKDKDSMELLKKITAEAFPDGDWQSAVALNQIIFLGKISERPDTAGKILAKFYEVWNKQPINLSPLLVEWRKQSIGSKLDPEIVLDTLQFDPSKQSYFDPAVSGTSVDFFMNMYKDELGVDVDALSDAVAKIVGEDLVGEFFRLVDIDAPMAPEEFVRRVEKAIEILATAKEQGLDVKRIFKKWDEMANAGGERMGYLAGAVKAVAEEAVRDRFWEAFVERTKKLKVPIIDDAPEIQNLLGILHSQGFIGIEAGAVTFSKDFDEILANTVEILMKISPSAIYTASDVTEMLNKIVSSGRSKESAVKTSRILAALKISALRRALEDNFLDAVVDAIDAVSRSGARDEEIVHALNDVLQESSPENLKQVLVNKIHEIKER